MRYRFIQDHECEYRITVMCRVLQVSRSGYYAWQTRPESPRERENRRLLTHLQAIHARSREAYGIVKMHRALRDDGIGCSRNRIARLR